jgi:hypothetical protein
MKIYIASGIKNKRGLEEAPPVSGNRAGAPLAKAMDAAGKCWILPDALFGSHRLRNVLCQGDE